MTYPRAHLVDQKNGGYYHCTSRCVRRAFLCGLDRLTGRSFEHRRAWIEQRILWLSTLFSVDVLTYAVMSNHYHVVVHVVPDRALDWEPIEVARRWLRLTRPRSVDEHAIEELASDLGRVDELRERLQSLSWFMRYLNEPIARRSNEEDDCKGRFWEGRFQSIALLDSTALLNCMVYVDLNPLRADPALSLRESRFTGLTHRLKRRERPLFPLGKLQISLNQYAELAQWTHAISGARNAEDIPVPRGLAITQQTPLEWIEGVQALKQKYRAYGLPNSLKRYVKKLRQMRLRCAVTLR